MKILIYGEACQYGVAFPLKEAYEKLGHYARIFDWPRYLFTYEKPSAINKIKDRCFFLKTAKRINTDLAAEITSVSYDLLIVIRGNHIYPATISLAKKHVPLVVNWNSDDFFNPKNNTKYMLECFDKYDCIFSSRAHLCDEYLNKGAQSFEVLNWYYRPDMLYSPQTRINNKWLRDIAFIGSWSKRRENLLSSLEGFDAKIWGAGWNKAQNAFIAKMECKPQIYMKDMLDVIGTSKINLNILTKENRDTTNIRNFEIPACGGFQLSERSDAILQLFEEGKEIACYESEDELQSKCDYFLRNDTERQKIALSGYYRLINSSNSVMDRASQILKKVASL